MAEDQTVGFDALDDWGPAMDSLLEARSQAECLKSNISTSHPEMGIQTARTLITVLDYILVLDEVIADILTKED